MNDLEICKRIAEIEKCEVYEKADEWYGHQMFVVQKVGGLPPMAYNPLTDKALCFDLMVKHNIELTPMREYFFATKIKEYDAYGAPEMYLNEGYGDDDPQRAICLAIIKMHTGE